MVKRIAIIAGALCLIYVAIWWIVAGIIEKRIVAALQKQGEHGIVIAWNDAGRTGFPFRFGAMLTGASLKSSIATITAAKARLSLGPWTPREMEIALPDGGDVALANLQAFHADAAGAVLTASRSEPADHTQEAGRLVFEIQDLSLPSDIVSPLGETIKRLYADMSLMGNPANTTSAGLARWASEGGTLEVHTLAIQWGALNANMDGTLALDGAQQPEGAFSAHISGLPQALDQLAAGGVIKPRTASLIGMGVGLLSKPEGEQATQTLTVPLSIQDQSLAISGFRVLKLPRFVL